MGLSSERANTTINKEAIDIILLDIKRTLILQRENKHILNEGRISEIIRSRLNLEKRILNVMTFNKKWSSFVEFSPS
jgi:hypothetical protein